MKPLQIRALLRLQLILLRRAWESPTMLHQTAQILSMGFSSLMAFSLGGLLGWLVLLLSSFAQQGSLPELLTQLLLFLLWGLISLIWLISPLLFVLQNENLHLDLHKLLIYPLSFSSLYGLHTLTGLLEPWSLFFYPLLLGLCGGALLAQKSGVILPLLLLFPIFVAVQVVWSRLLVNWLNNLLRSRQGRERTTLGLIVGILLLAFVPALIGNTLESHPEWQSLLREPTILLQLTLPLNLLLSFSPPGMATEVLMNALRGHSDQSFGALGGLCCWLLLGICCGQSLLRHMLSQPVAEESARERGLGLWQTDMFAGLNYATALIVKKDLRSLRRSVIGKLCFWLTPGLLLLLRFLSPLPPEAVWPSTALFMGAIGYIFMTALFLFCNCFGLDGAGFKLYLTAPLPIHHLLRAKHLALSCFVSLEFVCVLYLYQAFFNPIPLETLLFVLLTFATVLLGVLPLGTVLSIRFPTTLDLNQTRYRQSATPVLLAFQFLSLLLALPALAQFLAHYTGQPRNLVMAAFLALSGFTYYRLFPLQQELFQRECLNILEKVSPAPGNG